MESVFLPLKRKITVFPERLKSQDFDIIYADLTKIESFVGGMNTRLPLPNDAPEEIPRIILKSKDDKINCLISPQKIQIDWVPAVNAETIISLALEVLKKTIGVNSIIRVGNIEEYVLKVEDKRTFSSYLKPGIVGNLRDTLEVFSFDLTLNDSVSFADGESVRCNRFARLVSATRDVDNQRLIVVIIDFNTHPEEKLSWDIADFKQFITQSEDKLRYDDIVREMLI